ncbi:relaxase/mobilization nuclease domain-containing protein [Tomitella gaofuii]|uniref:relaxase/mobilization nuclease domain-containing protein n=1 Tax=Tomitella gaofuii TaxID=2760083 RepID=UPI0015F7E308|nr:relaxase/mobilization nuclease domain-containing protein [Tomitella gaofuii]
MAGSAEPMLLYGDSGLGNAEALDVGAMIDAPHARFGTEVLSPVREFDEESREYVTTGHKDQHVYHLILSAAPEDGKLTDGQWQAMATMVMDDLGFTEASGKRPAPWAAVNHGQGLSGQDHVHIVASLVRQDGTKVNPYKDFKTISAACARMEREHGLEVVAGREDKARLGSYTRAEVGKARREAREMDRTELERVVRRCAVTSAREDEFVRRVRHAGVLIRPRFAKGGEDTVVGYSVALRPPHKGMKAVWFGGGNLATDLRLPGVRAQLTVHTDEQAIDEWQAAARRQPVAYRGVEERAVKAEQIGKLSDHAKRWADYLESVDPANRGEWSRAAAYTSGALHSLADRIGDRDMHALAARIGRSAVPPKSAVPATGRVPHLTTFAVISAQSSRAINPTMAWAVLLGQLARTVEAFASANAAVGRAREAEGLRAQMRQTVTRVRESHPDAVMPEFAARAEEKMDTLRAEVSTASLWETRPAKDSARTPRSFGGGQRAAARPDAARRRRDDERSRG